MRSARCEMIHLVNAARANAESGARTNQRMRGEARGEKGGERPQRSVVERTIGSMERARLGEGRMRGDETSREEKKRGEEKARGEAGRSELALLGLLERIAAAVEALELIGRLLRQEFHEVLHLALALHTCTYIYMHYMYAAHCTRTM